MTMKKSLLFCTIISASAITGGAFAADCTSVSGSVTETKCKNLGYTMTASQCSGKNMVKCPLNTNWVWCGDGSSSSDESTDNNEDTDNVETTTCSSDYEWYYEGDITSVNHGSCTDSYGNTKYLISCRYSSGAKPKTNDSTGRPYCCDPSVYTYSSLPNGITIGTKGVQKCVDVYAPNLYNIPDGTPCDDTAYLFDADEEKCCHSSNGTCL